MDFIGCKSQIKFSMTSLLPLESGIDVYRLCRFCLNRDHERFSIFSEVSGISAKIKFCIPIEVRESDPLSLQICVNCIVKVEEIHDFIAVCLSSQKTLESWSKENELAAVSNSVTKVDEEPTACSPRPEAKAAEKYEELNAVWERGNIGQPSSSVLPTNSAPPSPSSNLSEYSSAPHSDEAFPEEVKCKKKKSENHSGRKSIGPDEVSHLFNITEKKYVCNICSYCCSLKGNFKKHMLRHKKNYRVCCEECSRGFYSLFDFRRHLSEGICKQNRVVKCNFCNRKYRSSQSLEDHVKSHSPGFIPSGFQCEVCGRTFLSRRGLEKHSASVHQGLRHKCEVCSKELTTAQGLKAHLELHTGQRRHVCTVCGKNFSSSSALTVHERTHSGEKPYGCEDCGRSFSQSSTLQVHRRYHSGERPFSCPLCPKSDKPEEQEDPLDLRQGTQEVGTGSSKTKWFTDSFSLFKPNPEVGSPVGPLFECGFCTKLFKQKANLCKHIKHFCSKDLKCNKCFLKCQSLEEFKTHKLTHRRQLPCNKCSHKASTPYKLTLHSLKHNKISRFNCTDCCQGFYFESEYRKHRRKKHETKDEKSCSVCGKIFRCREYLKSHLKIHETRFKFQCDSCGKTYSSLKSLKSHIETIHNNVKLQCNICEKYLSTSISLRDHIRAHKKERSFVCEVCGKGFTRARNLVLHDRVHSGLKPYSCSSCNKTFTQKSTLTVHKRFHTGERPYSCQYCPKRFITRTFCKAHEKNCEASSL